MPTKAKSFNFTSYNFQPQKKKIHFNYQINFVNGKPLTFRETISLPKAPDLKQVPKQLLDQLLADLHLMLGISYYKLYCPDTIKTKQPLSKEQAVFWQTVYQKGLGEFCYHNKLDPKTLGKFPATRKNQPKSYELLRKNRSLLGIGGGKDSIVAGELLKKQKQDLTALVVKTQAIDNVIEKISKLLGLKSMVIQRQLDKKLLQELPDSYSGHIPISAVYAFLGLLAAILYNYRYVTMANEYSSNFGNLKYKGLIINHQWSKSAEFENLFQNYVRNFLTPDITYFSALRPFYEFQVAEMFSQYQKYFPYFTSCNQNFRIKKGKNKSLWCNKCAKCVFVFTLLSAFLSKKELLKIFKQNLYQDKTLLPLLKNLLGFGKLKPFDCVGTFEESQAAFYLASKKFKNSLVHKALLKKIKKPEQLVKRVSGINDSLTLPAQFRFLGLKKILLLGYGKEGRITHQYLKKEYPDLKVSIADQKKSANYLNKQKNFELAVKTPGLPKEKVKIPYTTASNIFFSQVQNPIIGITGTKGKSTTASLIYEILKAGGKEVKLLGNMGNPMLKTLFNKVNTQTIFITELSSYQLADLQYSPQVAVVLNLFPDHMDYHQTKEKYEQAKKNIVNFQTNNDFFIYNNQNQQLKSWAKQTNSKAIAFNQGTKNYPTKLLGKHNQENIKAAVAVAKLFKIPENTIRKTIKEFKPLKYRLQLIGKYNKIKFYNDAISTTPESTIMAIKSLKNIGTILLGGQDRGYDFKQLEKTIRQYKIKNIVLFPNSGKRMIKNKKGLKILNTTKMNEAVKFAYKNTPKGKICLLSTASPSYSLWQNFEDKGNQFQKIVKKYSKK